MWGGSARADDTIESILAKPVSPGTLALLIEFNTDPRAVTRWAEALANPDPHVRATAARLLGVSAAASAVPRLRQAIATETDPAAALEMAMPLLSLGSAVDDASLLDAAKRIPAPALAIAVAKFRKQAALAELPAFLGLGVSTPTAVVILKAMLPDDSAELDRLAGAALAAGPAWWDGLLTAAVDADVALPAERVTAAAASSTQELADSTWWYAAVVSARGHPVAGLPSGRDSSVGTISPEGAFARELAARALKLPPTPQPRFEEAVRSGVGLAAPPFVHGQLRLSLKPLLTADERAALHIGPDRPDSVESRAPKTPTTEFAAIRTVSELPAGLVADVLKETGCRSPDSGDIAGAIVRFEGDRLREIRWIATSLSPQCDRAARCITAASLVPEWAAAPGKPELVALPMNKSFIGCLSRVEPPLADAMKGYRIGGNRPHEAPIRPPKKTRNTSPVYPSAAQNAGRQGIVVLEATISNAGCVSDVAVLRDSGTDLEIAALRAVSDWAFTPTLLHGTPVPVIMTVTVEFTLR